MEDADHSVRTRSNREFAKYAQRSRGKFVASDPLRHACNDHERRRAGVFKGVLRIDAGNELGAVKVTKGPARLVASDGLCNRPTPPEPCTSGVGVAVEGPRRDGFTLGWTRSAGSTEATAMASTARAIKTYKAHVTGSRTTEIIARSSSDAEIPCDGGGIVDGQPWAADGDDVPAGGAAGDDIHGRRPRQ